MPLKNGQEFSYMHLNFSFLGNMDVKGVKSISYKEKRESENLYGAGGEPVAIGYGNKEYEGEIELMRKDIIAIRDAAGKRSLLDIAPFDLIISFANGVDPVRTVTLRNVRFLEDGLEGATGDKELPLTIPLALTGIEYD